MWPPRATSAPVAAIASRSAARGSSPPRRRKSPRSRKRFPGNAADSPQHDRHREKDQDPARVAHAQRTDRETRRQARGQPQDGEGEHEDVGRPRQAPPGRCRRSGRSLHSSRRPAPERPDRRRRQPQGHESREEVTLGRPVALRERPPEAVLLSGRQERGQVSRIESHLSQIALHAVELGGGAVAERERNERKAAEGRRHQRAPGAAAPVREPLEPEGRERHAHEETGEDGEVHVGERVPGEGDGEEEKIPIAPLLEIPHQEQEQQREERSPLVLQVRDLLDPPREKRVDHAGRRRGHRIAGHVTRQRPGRQGGKEHAGEEEDVVVQQRRAARREDREAEEGNAEEILREGEDVAGGMEEVQLERDRGDCESSAR